MQFQYQYQRAERIVKVALDLVILLNFILTRTGCVAKVKFLDLDSTITIVLDMV